jgi:hypothetical protein
MIILYLIFVLDNTTGWPQTNKKMKISIYRNCNDVSLKLLYPMVALPNSRLFKCSINDQMLDYYGKNFLADVRVCPQKGHTKEKKNF